MTAVRRLKGVGVERGVFMYVHMYTHTHADVQLFGHACSNTHRHTAAVFLLQVFMQFGLVSRESY